VLGEDQAVASRDLTAEAAIIASFVKILSDIHENAASKDFKMDSIE